jgi:hypothetical protein
MRYQVKWLFPRPRTGFSPQDVCRQTAALWAKAQRGFEIALGRGESEALREALRFLVSDNFVSTFENSLTSAAAKLERHLGE